MVLHQEFYTLTSARTSRSSGRNLNKMSTFSPFSVLVVQKHSNSNNKGEMKYLLDIVDDCQLILVSRDYTGKK